MKKITKTQLASPLLLCALITGSANAGEALDAVNSKVTLQAEKIEQQYGILLTYSEMNDLKVSLIAHTQVAELENNYTASIVENAQAANEIYQLTDPVDQRKLLIEMQIVFGGGDDDPVVIKPKPKPKPEDKP